ncbi:glycosyltransferase [Streptomyces blattellae]|uniref:glycosyltransferase n=1 Tax=Streptomyces blattellae TaxID=2569855 RepID=UPI0012B9FA5C|nr:glycosyltransferase [Streptomyces blattellae]
MHAHISTYGIAVGSLLLAKLLLSLPLRRRPPAAFRDGAPLTVHAVITVYNETPEMLRRCLRSLIGQTRRPHSVTVIDDCSKTDHAAQVVGELRHRFATAGVDLELIRFPVNKGKRHGLAAGFDAQPGADVYLCIDSDTVLDQKAVAELLRPFAHRRVMCVTGLLLAHNRATNLLTRLIDMRYVNAFLGERVAYSRLGSVLCACGSLVAYRGWVARKHLDDFLSQTFLGKPATFGDDRRLTYYCLTEGKSLIQPAAVGRTDVPDRLGHYARQQIRWGKSFFREGLLLAAQLRYMGRAFWWLNLVELVTWLAFTAALMTALVVVAVHPAAWTILAGYVAVVCAMAWLRSIHYLRRAPGVPPADRLLTFAAAPLYALLNLAMLLPLRLYSLATLYRTGWGTRQHGAEVALDSPAAVLPDDDTVQLPRIPVAKLLDPETETTLTLPIPRQRTASPLSEGTPR